MWVQQHNDYGQQAKHTVWCLFGLTPAWAVTTSQIGSKHAKQLSGCIWDQLLCLSPFWSDKGRRVACPLASGMHSCDACMVAALSDSICCAEALLAGPSPHEEKQASGA